MIRYLETVTYLSRYMEGRVEAANVYQHIEHLCIEGGGGLHRSNNIYNLRQRWLEIQTKNLGLMHEISNIINTVDHYQARRVLMLHFIDGHKYEKVAEIMDCDVSTVYRWRKTGLKKITNDIFKIIPPPVSKNELH